MKKIASAALCLAVSPCALLASVATTPGCASGPASYLSESGDLHQLETKHARLKLDDKGFIVSLTSIATGQEYVPAGRPSPLLSLHEEGTSSDKLVEPAKATFNRGEITLAYPNGAVATVKVAVKEGYVRLKLEALANRGKVGGVVWGPLKTSIAGKIGDIIGVVRSKNFAIGMMGVDDNTIAGPITDGDCYGMGYYVHSEDPEKTPVPPQYKEGQWFNIGGDGVNDVAFYSHIEEYFHQVFGTGAKLEPEFGSTIAYSARDRRIARTHLFALLPGFKAYRPRHMVSDPVPGVDFIGSTVALYACPDDLGLAVLEKVHKDEGMPFITDNDGVWIRNPKAVRPVLYWNGPVDKAIEYTKAMGFKDISRDTGEYYPSLDKKWVGRVPTHDGKGMSYKEFGDECHKQGLTHGGLHTLVLFLQGGVSHDVTPVPSEHLQTVCRTKLAKPVSATDTEIEVTDPSFLADKGTWPAGDGSNYLRVGGEMMRYEGISDKAPWIIKGVKRGHASKAAAHAAGDELVKLQQNCYNGFVPDMTLMLDYADYYADLMARNGMDDIGFDGYESLMYQNHGYYAMKTFNRRLFETYHKLTGRWPHISGTSNIFAGSWEYIAECNVGGGGHMIDIPSGRLAPEGKDISMAFTSSWYPGAFGGQSWHKDWTLPVAENLMAKAVGWDAVFGLNVDQATLDATPERDAIFKAFKAWNEARAMGVFTKAQKEKLRDPAFKFHIERAGEKTFTLQTIRDGAIVATEQVGE